jgi:uncharacterized membrane protein
VFSVAKLLQAEDPGMTVLRFLAAEVGLIAAGVFSIVLAYAWVIPAAFKGYRTYSVLITVVLVVAGASAMLALRAAPSIPMTRWLFVLAAGSCAAVATVAIALFVLVNTIGS